MRNKKAILNELNNLIEDASNNDCSYGITDEEKETLINHAKSEITHFSIENGFISVDENSIQLINSFICDLVGISNAKCNSWLRSKGIWLTYRFLSLCLWTGKDVSFVSYDDWGPFIFNLDREQLAYYLFWRKRTICGEFSICTNAQIWLYTFDLILNTCVDDVNETLSALWKINQKYEELVPATSRKILNKSYHNRIIGDYCLYNMLISQYNVLPQEYRIFDDFPICESISKGLFADTGSYLESLAFTKKSVSKVDTKIAPHMPTILEKVFTGLFSICLEASTNLASDLIGEKRRHALWYPYSDTILNADTVRDACKSTHKSFLIEKNTYVFIEHDDMSSDPTLSEYAGSLYWNDHGDRLERKGMYYRQKYSGVTTAGKQLVTYIISSVRNSYRQINGLRTLKETPCPYGKLKHRIDELIDVAVRNYDFDVPVQKKANAVHSVVITDTKCTHNKDKFKYNVSVVQKKPTQALIVERKPIGFDRNSEREKWIKRQSERSSAMGNEERINKLKEHFRVLKDSAYKDDTSPLEKLGSDVVAPMLSLDTPTAIKMWEYLIQKYQFLKDESFSYYKITRDIVEESNTHYALVAIEQSDIIKNALFNIVAPNEFCFPSDFFVEAILEEKFDLIDFALKCIIENHTNQRQLAEILYSILNRIATTSKIRWYVSQKGVDKLREWASYIPVENKKNMVMLEVSNLDDILAGLAPKGAATTDMLSDSSVWNEILAGGHKRASKAPNYKVVESTAATVNTEAEKSEHTVYVANARSTNEEKLNAGLDKLNELIGLQAVKKDVNDLINFLRIQTIRQQRGMKVADMSLHLVFSGNPGTGKTTVARILGEIYNGLGILSKGHLVEVDRSGLVAGYVGQTALKTQEVIENSLGGILFIDEAYSLVVNTSENDFGKEAIDTLLKAMEDNRDNFVVIVAGYSKLMPKFIASNPGLKSRFNKIIEFADYSGEELSDIFHSFLHSNDYLITNEADLIVRHNFALMYEMRDENFGNARDVRNIFEKIITRQANRIISLSSPSDDEVRTIIVDDVMNGDIFECQDSHNDDPKAHFHN